MANWTPHRDRPDAIELPNFVAYVHYVSDDGREVWNVVKDKDNNDVQQSFRITFEFKSDLLNYTMKQCSNLTFMDDRAAQLRATFDDETTLEIGPIEFPPETIARREKEKQEEAVNQKINAALQKKLRAEATEIDPTIPAEITAAETVKG